MEGTPAAPAEITFSTQILNDFLTCPLCHGYFRDAMTISECLHTFCKSCIYKFFYFEQSKNCPECGVGLGTFPVQNLRSDRPKQAIIEKVFPDLEQLDSAVEKEFNKKWNSVHHVERAVTEQPTAKRVKSATSTVKPSTPNTPTAPVPAVPAVPVAPAPSEINFGIFTDPSSPYQFLLIRPFLRTAARATVFHLRKFLATKFGVAGPQLIEILYEGQKMDDNVLIENWRKEHCPNSTCPMFTFRISAKPALPPQGIMTHTPEGPTGAVVPANYTTEAMARKEKRREDEQSQAYLDAKAGIKTEEEPSTATDAMQVESTATEKKVESEVKKEPVS